MSWRSIGSIGCAFALAACGSRSVVPIERTAVLTTRSAVIARPTPPPTMSCSGKGLCRETVLLDGAEGAADDLAADCTHLGGRSSAGGCPRRGVVASCAVDSGEHGPITVLAYAQDDDEREHRTVDDMAELCESFNGTFELAKDAAGALDR